MTPVASPVHAVVYTAAAYVMSTSMRAEVCEVHAILAEATGKLMPTKQADKSGSDPRVPLTREWKDRIRAKMRARSIDQIPFAEKVASMVPKSAGNIDQPRIAKLLGEKQESSYLSIVRAISTLLDEHEPILDEDAERRDVQMMMDRLRNKFPDDYRRLIERVRRFLAAADEGGFGEGADNLP
jgi:hypothetical protein